MKEKEPKLIESKPELKNIYSVLNLLEGHINWQKELPGKIEPWENSIELFENVQKEVLKLVEEKVLSFRDNVKSISEISDIDMIDAIVNNWFEGVPETQGQRREVLLAIAAHVIKHIETSAYQEILQNAEETDLEKLGLDLELKDVMIKVLDACMKSDVLFIRSLAFTGLTQAPEEASLSHFYVPNDKNPHTINELFPKETQYLSRKFKEISAMPIDWGKFSGGEIFKEYLDVLSIAYQEKDVDKIDECYKNIATLYEKSSMSDFPILIIPPEYGWSYFPPYHQQEFRVCLKDPECLKKEKDALFVQSSMAKKLEEKNYPELGKNIRNKIIRVVNSIGDYGVNLSAKALAQAGDSVVIVWLGEQRKFYQKMLETNNFRIQNMDEKQGGEMALLTTVFHELGHCHDNSDPVFERFGEDAKVIIDDVKAEQLYRWIVPQMVEEGVIKGDKEQLAIAMLKNSLEWILDSPEGDPYYSAGVYNLNEMLEKKIVEFNLETGLVSIKDLDAFNKLNEELAKKVLNIYSDKSMNKQKAKKWIKENCTPNEITEKVSRFLKKEGNELPNNPKTGSIKVFPWETAWIKKPDPNNSDDVEAIKRIDKQPAVAEWMTGSALTEEDFSEENFYGVCEEKNEKGISGFVWLYEPDEETIVNLEKNKLVDFSKGMKVLEISFARYIDPDLPAENQKRGITSSAVRQICFSSIKNQKNIAITAFTNPKNLPSESVLRSAGFIIKGKVFYDKKSKEEDNFWILDKKELEKILKKKKAGL